MTLEFNESLFWAKVEKSDGCWLWHGAIGERGYGAFRIRKPRKTMRAHRIAYFLKHGELPALLMHSCDVRRCVNPEHILNGSPALNTADMMSKGRHRVGKGLCGDLNPARLHPELLPRGEKHGRATITEANVLLLLADRVLGASLGTLAERYNVRRDTVWRIISGKSWLHLPRPVGVALRLRTRAALPRDGQAKARDKERKGARKG